MWRGPPLLNLALREGELPADDFRSPDLQLVRYVERLWGEGEPKALAANALSGVQHLLLNRRRLLACQLGVLQRLGARLPCRVPPHAVG
eukprot:4622149-Alexandrium_andersonii.AAC.1